VAVDRRPYPPRAHRLRRLLAEGYDRDSARFFVIDAINAVLTRWRATRLLIRTTKRFERCHYPR
jgi:hypothetical protein